MTNGIAMGRRVACITAIAFVFGANSTGAENTPLSVSARAQLNLLGERVDQYEWHPEFADRCRLFGDLETPGNTPWSAILEPLSRSAEYTEPLIDVAANANVSFCLENREDGARGYFDLHYNILALRESLPVQQQALILMHELRHIDQVVRGFVPTLDFDQDEVIRQAFALEADVQAYSAYVAWKARELGDNTLWQALMSFDRYQDIAVAFEREIRSSSDTHKALVAAFRQWYRSGWRINVYFMNVGMTYLDMLDESKKLQRFERLPAEHFSNLCVLPEVGHYACDLTPEIRMSPRKLRKAMPIAGKELYSQWTILAF